MVPSPPERSARVSGLKPPFLFTEGTLFEISDITPYLPDTFSVRCVINGVSGLEKRYPEDDNSVIWENEGNKLTWSKYPGGNYLIGFSTEQSITINSFELYIDGEKVVL